MEMLIAVPVEIESLHAFFQDWFNGVLPRDKDALARMRGALDDRFIMITPSATIVDKEAIIRSVWEDHPGDAPSPEMRIVIDSIDSRPASDDVLIATYIERHRWKDESSDRQSTAIFVPSAGAPNGVAWLHLHETSIR